MLILFLLLLVAYEPVWAIGTGLTATPEMAQDTHASIRQWMAENVGADVAAAMAVCRRASFVLALSVRRSGFGMGVASMLGRALWDTRGDETWFSSL